MSKASTICESCGQDNEVGATFCIECGTSISTSKLGKPPALEESDPSDDKPLSAGNSEPHTDKSYQSETKTSPTFLMRCWQMMGTNFNPMFIMMPIMFIIMIVFIFRRFNLGT